MYSYPPAESKIPVSKILSAFIHSSEDFKKILCNYLHAENCILANSGRALLYLLLKTLKTKEKSSRNEVLIPGYTCYSVAAAIAKAGLDIRVYDLDPATLSPDYTSLEQAYTDKTLAVIVQHLFGIPVLIEPVKKILDRNVGSYIIEDAAQSLGGKINNRPSGTHGDFGIFSFGRGKPLPLGGGGALISKSMDFFSDFNMEYPNKGYISLLLTAVIQMLSKPFLYWIPEKLPLGLGETTFDFNFHVAPMPLLIQRLAEKSMTVLTDLNLHRSHISKIYEKAFKGKGAYPVSDKVFPVYTRFPLIAGLKPISKELKNLGVRRMYPQPILHVQSIKPYIADIHFNTPGALEIAQNLITLPTHTGINENLAREIIAKVKTAYTQK